MSREVHVRFCEQRRGKFPPLTLLVMGFEYKRDAERVMEVLWKRFARFGLELHSEKTRIVSFRRPGRGDKRDKRKLAEL